MDEKDKPDAVEVTLQDGTDPPPHTCSLWEDWVTLNASHLESFAGPEKDRKTTWKSSLKEDILLDAGEVLPQDPG